MRRPELTGYESVMLLCAIGTFLFTVASFVLDLFKALVKKDNNDK